MRFLSTSSESLKLTDIYERHFTYPDNWQPNNSNLNWLELTEPLEQKSFPEHFICPPIRHKHLPKPLFACQLHIVIVKQPYWPQLWTTLKWPIFIIQYSITDTLIISKLWSGRGNYLLCLARNEKQARNGKVNATE